MKKVAWLLFALVVGLVVMWCNKPSSEVEEVVTSETISSEIINEASIDVDKKEQERIDKLFENTDFPKNFTNAVEDYVFPFSFQFPNKRTSRHFGALKDFLSNNESYEETYKKYEASYIYELVNSNSGLVITETDKIEKTISGIQTFTLPSGKKIEYEFQYKFDDKVSIYSLMYYKLKNADDVVKPLHGTINVDSTLSYMGDDPECQKKLDMFSDYINDIIDVKNLGEFKLYSVSHLSDGREYEHLNTKLKAKCYVKGNFTNSGKDEYLVAYNRGKTLGDYNSYDEYIEIMACLIVENDQVIRSYKLPRVISIICEGWENAYSKLGESFSQGIVRDFNKNGLNEILFYNQQVLASDYTMFEFIDGLFKEYSIIASIDNSTYDNDTGIFISEDAGDMFDDGGYPLDYYWIESSIWSEKEKCYILISSEINIKEIQ